MEHPKSFQDKYLTYFQAKEFLEERRGLYDLDRSTIDDFCQQIYRFEDQLQHNNKEFA